MRTLAGRVLRAAHHLSKRAAQSFLGEYFEALSPRISTTKRTGASWTAKEDLALVFRQTEVAVKNYLGPSIRVYEIEIEGPFYAQWPPRSHTSIFGTRNPDKVKPYDVLTRFATRAYRTPGQVQRDRAYPRFGQTARTGRYTARSGDCDGHESHFVFAQFSVFVRK